MITEKVWFPELGEYKTWLTNTKLELRSKGYQILGMKEFETYTGGQKIHFTVQKEHHD